MPDQLDLSLLATVKDPDLRATLERLGNVMADVPPAPAPEQPSTAKIIQFPLFPETTRPVANDMARSALFSCVQGKDRVGRLPIFPVRFPVEPGEKWPYVSTSPTDPLCSRTATGVWPRHWRDTKRDWALSSAD